MADSPYGCPERARISSENLSTVSGDNSVHNRGAHGISPAKQVRFPDCTNFRQNDNMLILL
jgi:hypothetical protein